ncbi:CAAD domain-containing protein [Limnoraphis robusta]|uniref:CAAD domain-containing protein n=1 Tax=Limnoraphis robusta TaxID=1118279 RepID=UPI00128FC686|nr:CAAD domain-containing protein [Limnoraphis robusta]
MSSQEANMPDPKIETTTTPSSVEVKTTSVDPLTQATLDEQTTMTQFDEIKAKVVEVLAELPAYVSGFFGEYQKPIITILLIIAAIVSVRVLFAVIDALNDIPLLAPTFELIGMGYSAWFIYRYLLRASNRQELSQEIQAFWEQISGK